MAISLTRQAKAQEQVPFMDNNRVAELWAAIKTALAGKADLADLDSYTTPDAVATAINSALSGYATDSGVQAAIASALANYMDKSEIEDALAEVIADAAGLKFESVDELPETGTPNIIYLVPNGTEGGNVKDEYMWIDGAWEPLGSTSVNLQNYWSKDELRVMTTEELQAILV